MARSKRPFPTSLSSIKPEYQRLCDDLGGPAEIGSGVNSRDLEKYCQDYPLGKVLPSLKLFQQDETKARRYWPWAAFAISHYEFEHKKRGQYLNELSPKKIVELLAQIRESARSLASGLCQLQELSYRLDDPVAPSRRPHIAWLDELVSQAAAGRISDEVNNDDASLLAVHFNKLRLLERLADIEAAATKAQERVDRRLLERERGQSDPALSNFVMRCGKIWTGLTGRVPSANRVHPNSNVPDKDPDFVVFVQALARVGASHEPTRDRVLTCEPTRDQVLTCLRKSKSQGDYG
jgi:hypothetical protein